MTLEQRFIAFRQMLVQIVYGESGGYLTPSMMESIIQEVFGIACQAERDHQLRLIVNSEEGNIGLNVKFPVLVNEKQFSVDKSSRAAHN